MPDEDKTVKEETTTTKEETTAKEETTPKETTNDKFVVQLEDGKTWEVNANDYIMLATLGANTLYNKRKSQEEEKKKVTTQATEEEAENEVVTLRNRLDKLEKEKNAEKVMNDINRELSQAANKNERLKGNEQLTNMLNAVALAQHYQNPNQSLTKLFDHATKVFEDAVNAEVEKEKNKLKGNKFVTNITNQTTRGGSASTIETGKKFSAEDVRKGASRRSMQEFLEKAFQ